MRQPRLTREVLPVRIKPKAKAEIQRMARRKGDNTSAYAARILEAHTQGLIFCATCGYEHEIYHPILAPSRVRP